MMKMESLGELQREGVTEIDDEEQQQLNTIEVVIGNNFLWLSITKQRRGGVGSFTSRFDSSRFEAKDHENR